MLESLGKRAKAAAAELALLRTADKNAALEAIAEALERNIPTLLNANEKDLSAAQENAMSASLQDRLRLTPERICAMSAAVRELISLRDPVGVTLDGSVRPNGLEITRVSVPLGVVGVIFESRPNVSVDCATLCLKAGNASILRGGKEAIHSNTALVDTMREALSRTRVPVDAVQLVEDTSRDSAGAMMKMSGYLDVLIPRGGAGLIRAVVENASVPVIETGVGVCHAFVDESADLDMAVSIVNNAKTSRPSVCNALETLLVHANIAGQFLPAVKMELDKSGVELRGCEKTRQILGDCVVPATAEDYHTEYGDFILSVKVVEDIAAAIRHIGIHSTHHSEAIITSGLENARLFANSVDSAAVYVNASTRFTDGGEFGLGAEIGISTQKLHARGPMGLSELVSYKYVIRGSGQIR